MSYCTFLANMTGFLSSFKTVDKTPVAQGGYGSVYKCVTNSGKVVACKVLPKTVNNARQVQHEVYIMRKVTQAGCKHVAKLIDSGEDDMSYYIVQDFIYGMPIIDPLSNSHAYDEKSIARIAYNVLDGLASIHDIGIIHRDIKPRNILLTNNADVKIIDFGIAIEYNIDADETKIDATMNACTPFYMPPEALRSVCVPSSDVWSLGVLVYLLLYRTLPFNDTKYPTSPRLEQIWRSIMFDKVRLGTMSTNVSTSAQDFVSMCLQKDHTKRLSTYDCLRHPWFADMIR